MGVGPYEFDVSWWNGDDGVIALRPCFYDDEYLIKADGTFELDLQNETWVELWQGGSDACDGPVAPHDGSTDATWRFSPENGTLTVQGKGRTSGSKQSMAVSWQRLQRPEASPTMSTNKVRTPNPHGQFWWSR